MHEVMMKRQLMAQHLSAITIVAGLLVTSPALAQVIQTWGANEDGVLDMQEFRRGLERSGTFAEWDLDDDEELGFSEFATGLYRLWDTSGDGILSVDEWDTAVDFLEAWDEDGSGTISRTEFAEGPYERSDRQGTQGGEQAA